MFIYKKITSLAQSPLISVQMLKRVRELRVDSRGERVVEQGEVDDFRAVEDVAIVVNPLLEPPNITAEAREGRSRPGENVVIGGEVATRVEVGPLALAVIVVRLGGQINNFTTQNIIKSARNTVRCPAESARRGRPRRRPPRRRPRGGPAS